MGSADDDPLAFDWEKPAHKVTLSEFWIGIYEVTNEQFRRFRPDHAGDAKLPAVNVSWTDAKEFCESSLWGFSFPRKRNGSMRPGPECRRRKEAEPLGPSRHARQRLGVGCRLVRSLLRRATDRSDRLSDIERAVCSAGFARGRVLGRAPGLALGVPGQERARGQGRVLRLSLCAQSPLSGPTDQ